MTIFQHIAAECRTDRVFELMIFGLGFWSAISLAILALNAVGLLPAS